MPSPPVPTTPNILLLFVDQMRADAMGCAGHPVVRTPHLDRLAGEGARYTRAYTPVPVCIAARHSLLFGHRCATHGRFANNVPAVEPLLPSLPGLLSFAGYHTQAIGKMHFRPVRRHNGFCRMELMEEIPDHRQDDEYLLFLRDHGYGHVRAVHGVRQLLYQLPQRSILPVELHGSSWVADRTVEFLRQNATRPFFCWSSWIAPHPPFNAPEPFASMYGNDDCGAPINWSRDLATLPPMLHPQSQQLGNGCMDRISAAALGRVRALYHAQISLIDQGIGRILHALDELDLADNTLVIFASDHGEMLGDNGLWQKSMPFEAASRVPFLVRYPPRVAAGETRDELVSLLDILPTALDLAGLDYPGDRPLPGASLLQAPGGGAARPRSELVIEHGPPRHRWLSLIAGQVKYNAFLADGYEELYDLAADPAEQHNLLLDGDPAARREAATMRARLAAWEAEWGYRECVDTNGLVSGNWTPPACGRTVNLQTPRWVARLPAGERALMNTLGEEMAAVLAGEDTVDLEALDLATWQASGESNVTAALNHLRAVRR